MLTKILLVYPNFHYFPGWLENRLNYKQVPLGLAYLASAVRDKYPVEVRICDASFLDIKEDGVVQYARAFKPDIVGMAAYTPTMGFIRNIALSIRNFLPESLIVFGGPHVTALPFENLDVADLCILGEGELTFDEVVGSIIANKDREEIRGVSFKKNGSCFRTKDRELIENLDILSFPARDFYPNKTYRHIYPYPLKNSYYNAIITSRGCSYDCNFCANELMWHKRVRYRSLDNVFEEIEGMVKIYNMSLLHISDDTFASDQGRAIEFCHRKNKLFPGLKWYCHSRCDTITPDLASEMKESGCVEVQIGVESGDDTILHNCNKMITAYTIEKAVRILKKNKINVWATIIIGNEGDTRKTIEKTIKFARRIDPTYCSFMFLSPLPGTKSYDNMTRNGYIKIENWSKYNWHSEPVFETEELSKKLLMHMRKRAYREFYLRPKVLARYIFATFKSRQWETVFSDFLLLIKFIFGFISR